MAAEEDEVKSLVGFSGIKGLLLILKEERKANLSRGRDKVPSKERY